MQTNDIFYPKVSIVIPVYNGANYMREAIDSALAQTYKNIEIIVINDGSNDNGATREIALSYGERICYIEKENGGVSSALNMGISRMTGEYFSWLSHDDAYAPDKVSNSISYLSSFENSDRLVVMCGSYYINEKSERIRDEHSRFERDKVYPGVEVVRDILTHGMLNCCCMLIPRKAFEICGMFNEDLRYNQDALVLYQIFGGGYNLVACHDQKDVMYRLHAMQTSNTRRDLLLRDSYELAKIIAPVFAIQDSKAHGLLWLLTKKNALHNCKDAVNECVRIGRLHRIMPLKDRIGILFWQVFGMLRNILKYLYRSIYFK